jgi:hypothetical protein
LRPQDRAPKVDPHARSLKFVRAPAYEPSVPQNVPRGNFFAIKDRICPRVDGPCLKPISPGDTDASATSAEGSGSEPPSTARSACLPHNPSPIVPKTRIASSAGLVRPPLEPAAGRFILLSADNKSHGPLLQSNGTPEHCDFAGRKPTIVPTAGRISQEPFRTIPWKFTKRLAKFPHSRTAPRKLVTFLSLRKPRGKPSVHSRIASARSSSLGCSPNRRSLPQNRLLFGLNSAGVDTPEPNLPTQIDSQPRSDLACFQKRLICAPHYLKGAKRDKRLRIAASFPQNSVDSAQLS